MSNPSATMRAWNVTTVRLGRSGCGGSGRRGGGCRGLLRRLDLVARLGQIALLPLVVVKEAVALRLVGALAAFDAALLARPTLRCGGMCLAAVTLLFSHRDAPSTTMARPLQAGSRGGRVNERVGLIVVGLGSVGSSLI